MTDEHTRKQAVPVGSWSRRQAIPALGTLVLAAVAVPGAVARQGEATPVADGEVREATMPDWRFGLETLQSPYEGALTKPDGLPAGVRVLACEVVLHNMATQPLEFMVTDVRLRDIDGVEYRAGEYLGTEPRLVSQNLPDGERTRGWVWFGLAEDVEPTAIVFIAPPPVLRISLE